MTTPYWTSNCGRCEVYQGDALAVLRGLPDGLARCCVTSPPYWGLRDYGTAKWEGGDAGCDHKGKPFATKANINANCGTGADRKNAEDREFFRDTCGKCGARRIDAQLGLEATPDAYIASMVAVFREVRRVLADDGTLWLNLGSSYASGGSDPTQSRSDPRAPACGSDGTALLDSLGTGRACPCCGDALRADSLIHHGRTGRTDQPRGRSSPHALPTDRDSGPTDCEPGSPPLSPPGARASTMLESSPRPLGECCHCPSCGACLSVLGSSSPDALACVHTGWSLGTLDTSTRDTVLSRLGTASLGLAWSSLAIPALRFKPKDLVGIPWMLAFALRADGWYLRQDIIWSKPNPMPESVRDRCTKAHEYLFLLSKRERYYYDAEAVAEKSIGTDATPRFGGNKYGDSDDPHHATKSGNEYQDTGTRNRRSVWTVATAPYPEAHFATYPPALITPCILAGSAPGDTVLDPFTGSGTTGAVAAKHGRRFVGVELNPDYITLAAKRISGEANHLFAETAT